MNPDEPTKPREKSHGVIPRMLRINHIALVVDNLEQACRFYEEEFQLEALPGYKFDYPAQFYRINDEQQLHLTEWDDQPSFRGHACIQVDDFAACFRRMKARRAIDLKPWGKVRKLPDGTYQMFVRDPSGNLIEISAPPGSDVDPQVFEDQEFAQSDPGPYRSGRNDARGLQGDDATLYHGSE
ncbi:MAG: VOC family protein [Planctomycetota bacterium]